MDRFLGKDGDDSEVEVDEGFEFESFCCPPQYEEIPSVAAPAADDESLASMVVSEECEGRPRRVKYASLPLLYCMYVNGRKSKYDSLNESVIGTSSRKGTR